MCATNNDIWLCVNCGKPADPDLFDYCVECDAMFSEIARQRGL